MSKKNRKKTNNPTKKTAGQKSISRKINPLSGNYDMVWVGLTMIHVLIFIYCLTAISNFNNPTDDDDTAPKTEREKAIAQQKSIKPIRPIATPIAASYGLLTLGLWLAMLFMPSKPTGSAGRFLIMMLAPGSLMALFAVLQIFIYP